MICPYCSEDTMSLVTTRDGKLYCTTCKENYFSLIQKNEDGTDQQVWIVPEKNRQKIEELIANLPKDAATVTKK